MATFVHNEPTSLATIQEIGLPETFFSAIEAGVDPAIEVSFYSNSRFYLSSTPP
jgi:E3 ubiquitin-protein ligase HUWE1